MKKVILVGIMFMMFMGVVSASSKNGEYEGNPIVKIINNGITVDPEDVPAVIYNGRTMIPISILKKLGANVLWNQEKYSVSVDFPTKYPEIDNTNNSIDKNTINYVKLANMYKLVQDLSLRLRDYSTTLSLYFTGYNSYSSNPIKDSDVNDRFSDIIDHYNLMSNKFNALTTEINGLDVSKLQEAIQNDFDSIDSYKLATTDIMSWKYYFTNQKFTQSQPFFDSYLKESGDGFTLSNQAFNTCINEYDANILKVIN